MNETGEQVELKLSWYDYVWYFPMALPFIKSHIKAWWRGLGDDW